MMKKLHPLKRFFKQPKLKELMRLNLTMMLLLLKQNMLTLLKISKTPLELTEESKQMEDLTMMKRNSILVERDHMKSLKLELIQHQKRMLRLMTRLMPRIRMERIRNSQNHKIQIIHTRRKLIHLKLFLLLLKPKEHGKLDQMPRLRLPKINILNNLKMKRMQLDLQEESKLMEDLTKEVHSEESHQVLLKLIQFQQLQLMPKQRPQLQ